MACVTSRSRAISKDSVFDDCVILSKDAFDPGAVFHDDIVDDEVLPYLSLEVDGLTGAREARDGSFELRPDDVAANQSYTACDSLPQADLGAEGLEVYGWESSLWRKIKGYLGF